jgi:hypothetical protein
MTSTSLARADASFQEQVHRQWRDWRAYLQAHLTLLEAQTAERQSAFEREDALEEQIGQAQRSLATLPAGQRALFDRLREERRQRMQEAAEASARTQSQTRATDFDQIERQTLTQLLAEAEGLADGPDRTIGWGDVPLQGDDGAQWYRVHVQALLEAPGAAAYASGRPEILDMRRRMMFAGLLSLAGLLFLGVWFLWPRSAARPPAVAEAAILVNDTPVEPWPVRAVTLTLRDGTLLDINLSPTESASWPTVADSAVAGFWRREAVAPIALCLPAALLSEAASLRLLSEAQMPERTYLLSAAQAGQSDLIVEACERGGARRFGTVQAVEMPPLKAIGEAVTIAKTVQITVTQIAIVGPGQEPDLPAGTARVIVTLMAPPIDWPTYAPTLLLASGEVLQSPEVHTTTDGVELRYVASLPTQELEVAWSIVAPASRTAARWRARLTPPPDRQMVVQAALAVRSIRVISTTTSVGIEITLLNQSSSPLLLHASDFTLTQGGQSVTIPDLARLQRPFDPGESRIIEIPLPTHDRASTLNLTIGSARYAIEPQSP